MWRLINITLYVAILVVLILILRGVRKLVEKGGAMADQLDNLGAAVQRVAEGEAALEERVDTIIEALKMPHDDPRVGKMIADLEAIRAKQDSFQSTDQPPGESTDSTDSQ